jgi:hypothetical protein
MSFPQIAVDASSPRRFGRGFIGWAVFFIRRNSRYSTCRPFGAHCPNFQDTCTAPVEAERQKISSSPNGNALRLANKGKTRPEDLASSATGP